MTGSHLAVLFAALLASAVAGYLLYDSQQEKTAAVDPPSGSPGGLAASHDQALRMRPEFSLPDLDGKLRSISEWDGQAMIVNFWATWCPPCRREIPLLIDLEDEAASAGIQILGIAIDTPAEVNVFAENAGFNYPVLVGEQEALDAAEGYGAAVIGLPLTVMTDYQGRVVNVHAGELSREDLEKIIDQLSEKASKITETQ